MESILVAVFCNWKDGTHCFSRHEGTSAHKTAADVIINIRTTYIKRCGRFVVFSLHTTEGLKLSLPGQSCSKYQVFIRQGVSLRSDGDENDSNFMQLMHLCAHDDTTVNDMLRKKIDKYASPQSWHIKFL